MAFLWFSHSRTRCQSTMLKRRREIRRSMRPLKSTRRTKLKKSTFQAMAIPVNQPLERSMLFSISSWWVTGEDWVHGVVCWYMWGKGCFIDVLNPFVPSSLPCLFNGSLASALSYLVLSYPLIYLPDYPIAYFLTYLCTYVPMHIHRYYTYLLAYLPTFMPASLL